MVSAARIRCHMIEVPVRQEQMPRRSEWPRDLLPWADPYIAVLMRRLEDRFDMDDAAAKGSDSFVADDAPWMIDADEDWQNDAFMPQPIEATRERWYPEVYGGWPLLDDLNQEASTLGR